MATKPAKPGLYANIHANASALPPAAVRKCASPARRAHPPPRRSASRPRRPNRRGNDVPLVKSSSKEAFRKNVKTEMAHGKPQKQAVAIAYSTQQAAKAPAKGKK